MVYQAGDTFTIEYNTDGFNDNSNTLNLADLQNESLVQLSSEATNKPRTFQDAYASMVGRIGGEASMAKVSLASAEAMKSAIRKLVSVCFRSKLRRRSSEFNQISTELCCRCSYSYHGSKLAQHHTTVGWIKNAYFYKPNL